MKQDLLKKQREDKERGDSYTPSPASSTPIDTPTQRSSPHYGELAPDSPRVKELPTTSVEVQFKLDQLQSEVLNNLSVRSEESAVKIIMEEKV